MHRPFTLTRPATIHLAASVREQIPCLESTRASSFAIELSMSFYGRVAICVTAGAKANASQPSRISNCEIFKS